jgi:hypothetical protein
MVLCEPQKSSEHLKIKLSDDSLFLLEKLNNHLGTSISSIEIWTELLKTNDVKVANVNKAVCNIVEYQHILCVLCTERSFNQWKAI